MFQPREESYSSEGRQSFTNREESDSEDSEGLYRDAEASIDCEAETARGDQRDLLEFDAPDMEKENTHEKKKPQKKKTDKTKLICVIGCIVVLLISLGVVSYLFAGALQEIKRLESKSSTGCSCDEKESQIEELQRQLDAIISKNEESESNTTITEESNNSTKKEDTEHKSIFKFFMHVLEPFIAYGIISEKEVVERVYESLMMKFDPRNLRWGVFLSQFSPEGILLTKLAVDTYGIETSYKVPEDQKEIRGLIVKVLTPAWLPVLKCAMQKYGHYFWIAEYKKQIDDNKSIIQHAMSTQPAREDASHLIKCEKAFLHAVSKKNAIELEVNSLKDLAESIGELSSNISIQESLDPSKELEVKNKLKEKIKTLQQ